MSILRAVFVLVVFITLSITVLSLILNISPHKLIHHYKRPGNLYLFREPSHHYSKDHFLQTSQFHVVSYGPAPSTHTPEIVIYVHGSGENTLTTSPRANALSRDWKLPVISLEYPGFRPFSFHEAGNYVTLQSHLVSAIRHYSQLASSRVILIGDDLGAMAVLHSLAEVMADRRDRDANPHYPHYVVVLRNAFEDLQEWFSGRAHTLGLDPLLKTVIDPWNAERPLLLLHNHPNVQLFVEDPTDADLQNHVHEFIQRYDLHDRLMSEQDWKKQIVLTSK